MVQRIEFKKPNGDTITWVVAAVFWVTMMVAWISLTGIAHGLGGNTTCVSATK